MTRSLYPIVLTDRDVVNALKEICRLREVEDISDFKNLNNVFVSGRTTFREPSSTIDVVATDNEGDIVVNAAGTYEYKLISVAGTLKWDRRGTDTAW